MTPSISVLAKNIEATQSRIKVKVNGKQSTAPNYIIDGRTYMQLRDVTKMLNKDINWDEKTFTVYITDKKPDKPVLFSNYSTKYDGDSTYLTGEMINIDTINHSGSFIVVYYAADKTILGTSVDHWFDLKPGEKKVFESGPAFDNFLNAADFKIQTTSNGNTFWN